jgi:SecD/SecF fusion protein
MQNKGAVKLFAIALALVCIYQLSFTWFAAQVESKASEYSKNDLNKEQAYLDSVKSKVVYNFMFGLQKFTYMDCKERQINLGLDLKGGMNVVLEVSEPDILLALANYSTDTTFRKAMALGEQYQKDKREDFITSFDRAFNKVDPNAKLAAIFAVGLKGKIKFTSTNSDVISAIRKEANDAIDNSFNILRTRIDKYGVIQPNIQQLETKGRIQVQLPGVKDPERVASLLQGTANLEFWETYENSEIYNFLMEANKKIKQIEDAKVKIDSTSLTDSTKKSTKPAVENKLSALQKEIEKNKLKGEGGKKINDQAKDFPLFSLLRPNITRDNKISRGSEVGYASGRDTAKIDYYLNLPQVRSLFPRDVRFMWSSKPADWDKSFFKLHAIKANTRDGRAPLDGSSVTSARGDYAQGKAEAEVDMNMNGEGAKTWARLTKNNIGRCIAIVLDNYVVSAPVVHGEIPNGSSQISGGFTIDEAKEMAIKLKSGTMPAPARIVQKDVVGPSLGKESINASLRSFIIAFIGILLYMWLYYGRAGNVANVALFANVFFLFGVFASMGLVLTLPGFAGIILTLAMAVDGNVIIYERMREEERAGKGARMVVKDGFWHAYSAIIDGHVTTILTGIVLWLFGTGPVQGFATSLIVGLLLSLFSSIFIARLMCEWMLDKNIKITLGNKFTINAMTKANIDFIGIRKKMYVISGIVIGIGIVSLFVRGLDPSVDFTGGRTYTVAFDHAVVTGDIRTSLAKTFGEAPEVITIGSESRVKITTKYLINDKSTKTDSIVNIKLFNGLKSYYNTPITYQKFSENALDKTVGELSSQKVDPVISKELIYKAFLAIFFGLIIIFIYIAIRFKNWKYGIGGIVSLTHDTLIVITAFSLFYGFLPFSLQIDQSFIAALLTIIGYSIMDTVIIYDRIREYKELYPSRPLDVNINSAINHTLGRTINTSGITIVVLVVMFFFGGDILKGFIFALLVGVITGTYSSVFNATPVAYDIIRMTEKKKQK